MIWNLCRKCYAVLPERKMLREGECHCLNCDRLHHLEIFPAILKEAEQGKEAEKKIMDEDANCFFHEDKVASILCEQCGVYMCSLCDLEIDGRHICPQCFKKQKDNINTLTKRANLYDEILLSLSILTFFLWFLTFVTAPAIFVASIICWDKVKTPYRRGKWRFAVAMGIAVIQIMVWSGILIALLAR